MRRDPHPSAEWGAAVAVLGLALIGLCAAGTAAVSALLAVFGGI